MPNDARPRVDPFALALIVLLFAEQLLFGGDRLDLSLLVAILQLGLLLALIGAARGGEPPRLPLAGPAILFGAVFAMGLFSVLPVGPPLAHPLWTYIQKLSPGTPATVSMDPAATRMQLVKLAGLGALFLVGASLGGRREGAEKAGRYLAIAGTAYCLWAGVSFIVAPHAAAAVQGFPARLTAALPSPNVAATLFAGLTIWALAGLMRPILRIRPPGQRITAAEINPLWPEALLGALALPCLFLTASRGGLLALAAAVFFIIGLTAWLRSARNSLTGGVVAVVCLAPVAGAILFLFGGEQTAARLRDTDLLSLDRLKMFAAYWPTIKASPWLGYGLGAFRSFNAASMTFDNAADLAGLGAAHNVYIQWLLQQGAPGAFAMIGCIAIILVRTIRGALRRSSQRAMVLSCLGVAAVFAIHGLVDFALETPSMAAFFSAVLGLGFGLAERPAGQGGVKLPPKAVGTRTNGGSRPPPPAPAPPGLPPDPPPNPRRRKIGGTV